MEFIQRFNQAQLEMSWGYHVTFSLAQACTSLDMNR